MLQAKNFTCQAAASYLRPASASPSTVTFLSIKWTVTWNDSLNRPHTRTGVAHFGQNGLQLSYQK